MAERSERPVGLEGLTEEEYRSYWWKATQKPYQGIEGRKRLAAETGYPLLPPEVAKV